MNRGTAASSLLAMTSRMKQYSGLAFEGKAADFFTDAISMASSFGIDVPDSIKTQAEASELFSALAKQATLQRRQGVRDPQLNAQENVFFLLLYFGGYSLPMVQG